MKCEYIGCFYIWLFIENMGGIGTLERELSIYRELQNKFDHKFTFLTYGDISDDEINIMNLDVDIIPIYKFQKKSKFKLIDILKLYILY